jgi:DNA (cytosine-5)-methyltransferase 1
MVMEPVTLEPGIAAREGGHIYEGVSGTLRANAGDNQMAVAHPVIAVDQGGGKSGAHSYEGVSPTLTCTHGGEPAVVYGIQGSMIGRADHNGPQGDGVNEDVSFTLNTTDRHAVCYNIGSYHSNAWKSDNPNSGVYEADKSKTLDALQCGYPGCNQGGMAVVELRKVYSLDEKMGQTYVWEDQANTLAARDYKQPQMVCFRSYQDVTGPLMANSHPGSYTGQDAYSDMLIAGPIPYQDTVGSLCARDYKGVGSQYVDEGKCVVERQQQVRYIVRRLTPLECERLQGFPDGWTDIGEWVDSKGKKHKEADSPRYKALGNSIALPPWKWVLKRLCGCYERDATMASLFDGIGGFPLIWEQLNGNGSCLWASEIEEFPIAVTKLRFGGNENG